MKLLVKGIGQLVSVCEGQNFLAGKEMANIKIKDGCLAVAVDNNGKIAMVGTQKEVNFKDIWNEQKSNIDEQIKLFLQLSLARLGHRVVFPHLHKMQLTVDTNAKLQQDRTFFKVKLYSEE